MAAEYDGRFEDVLRQAVIDGLVIVDSEGQIRLADEAADLTLGYGSGQWASGQIPDVWSSSLSGMPADIEFPDRDDRLVPGTPTSAPVAAGPGAEPPVTMVDRGELERLDGQLLQVQRLAGVGTLTSSAARELTNPLSVITAACTNLKDELADGELTAEQMARYADMIEQSAFRCARIIEVLQRYTHTDGDEPNMAITSPAEIVHDALTLVEEQFRNQSHVDVETEITPGLQSIVCDHNRITQVLVNLLLNARDAMQPRGGTIAVRFWPLGTLLSVHPVLNGENGHTGQEQREYFAFSVTDTGSGIEPAVLGHLFDPFYTTKPTGQGAGLGLVIAQRIVAQHGGRLWAENNPGGGATFTVVLPKRQ